MPGDTGYRNSHQGSLPSPGGVALQPGAPLGKWHRRVRIPACTIVFMCIIIMYPAYGPDFPLNQLYLSWLYSKAFAPFRPIPANVVYRNCIIFKQTGFNLIYSQHNNQCVVHLVRNVHGKYNKHI